ncbi:hypothetical protein D3C78_592530 [compost metagenome]
MFIIKSPLSRLPEREYIYDVIFGEFLGLPYTLEFDDRSSIEITCPEVNSHQIRFPDVLLGIEEKKWLTPESLPKSPSSRMQVGEEMLARLGVADEKGIPAIYGMSGASEVPLQTSDSGIWCDLDLFGSCFFMLTRYEEVVAAVSRDQHDRFTSEQSYSVREGMLHYPIVNVYLELLWSFVADLWPQLSSFRKSRTIQKLLSHDVDHPFFAHRRRSRVSLAKESLGDLFKRGDIESGLRKGKMIGRRNRIDRDPYNTFDWLMDLSERAGVKSAFFFITEHTEPRYDGNYSMDDPDISHLLQKIQQRGHEVGLHPSYQTYLSSERIKKQYDYLQQAAAIAGIQQEQYGGRQHFLRWRAPDTWQHWEDAGLHYDSTLGYADRPGFRCGTCYEYPVFNLHTRKRLRLRERPLIVMEQSLIHSQYEGLNPEQAFEVIHSLYRQCVKHGGEFTLLWHNSNLVRSRDRRLYRMCMEELK